MLRSGTLISSGAVKGVSGLLSSSGGEFGLFQDDQQGCQGTPSCCEGILTTCSIGTDAGESGII